ncbi:MAG: signal peptide peptidase SppA [Desulfatibacillaceae bacterium]
MFVRRHPYLFFLLATFCVFAACVFALSFMVSVIVGAVSGAGTIETSGDRIGVVKIEGTLTDSDHIIRSLRKFAEKDSVKAVVLRVNSPGGAVAPSQEIAAEIAALRQRKNVVVSMGSVAASGGYYVAAPANEIFANPGTITGSIGVIMGWANARELLKTIGLEPVIIKSGEHKDMVSYTRDLTDEERSMLKEMVDTVHSQFVAAVATGRNMEESRVRELADGRIFTGEKAMELGLVDDLGNFNDAIARAAELGGIPGKPTLEYGRDPRLEWLDYLVNTTVKRLVMEMRASAETPVPEYR